MPEAPGSPSTVGEAIRWGAAQLQSAGVETPLVDSRLLMAYALGAAPSAKTSVEVPRIPVSTTEVFFNHDHSTPGVFADWIRQRTQRIPAQHIVGAAVFDGVDFLCHPGGFIPRPETELLVDWAFHEALRRAKIHRDEATNSDDSSPCISVVDLCTGPGSIALALACRFSDATQNALITGIELHEAALRLARDNEAQLRHRGLISDNVEVRFLRCDLLDVEEVRKLPMGASPDVIVSNPPYVPTSAPVSAEVLHDPSDAVFAGTEGMDFLPGLLGALGTIAGGEEVGVGIEHDDANGAATVRALEEAGARVVEQHRDVAGRDRFVTGTWHS